MSTSERDGIENVKRHRHKASRNQRYRKALERLGYGELVQLFAQSREQNYCKRKAHPPENKPLRVAVSRVYPPIMLSSATPRIAQLVVISGR